MPLRVFLKILKIINGRGEIMNEERMMEERRRRMAQETSEERRMETDISEEEKTAEVWTESDKATTSSDVEREYEKGKTPRVDSDLPTFKGEIHVNEGMEGRGKNLLGDKQSGGYSWTKGEGISHEEMSRRIGRGQQKTR